MGMDFIDYKDPKYAEWVATLPVEKRSLVEEKSLEELAELCDENLEERQKLHGEYLRIRAYEAIAKHKQKRSDQESTELKKDARELKSSPQLLFLYMRGDKCLINGDKKLTFSLTSEHDVTMITDAVIYFCNSRFISYQNREEVMDIVLKAMNENIARASARSNQAAADDKEGKNQDLLEIINENCLEFFSDQYGKSYAVIKVNSHNETIALGSNNFKHWIARLCYQQTGKVPITEAIRTILNVLKAKALFEGPRRHIETRIAGTRDESGSATIYYDLTDENWRCVKISREGWTIEQSPVLFARYNNNAAQVEPRRDYPPGIFDRFLGLINIADDDHKLLLKCHIVCMFIPAISKAILDTHGEQGSGKSLLQRLVKAIVDPSAAEKLSFPKSATELIQQLSHNYIAMYDNISRLDDWISDELCKAVDGSGSSKRQLYSDDDDIIYNFKRCIMLNGINMAARKPDLVDRTIIIQLERIPREKRRKESQLLSEFEEMKPALLGFIFDNLVKVLNYNQKVELKEYPRLADYAECCEIIARCLGYKEGEFIRAYFENIKLQNDAVLEDNPVAIAIRKLMEPVDMKIVRLTPRELLEKLGEIAEEQKLNTQAHSWPKAPNYLTRRLNEVKTNLREAGIIVEIETDRKTNTRIVSIRKISPVSPDARELQNQAQNGPENP